MTLHRQVPVNGSSGMSDLTRLAMLLKHSIAMLDSQPGLMLAVNVSRAKHTKEAEQTCALDWLFSY